MNQKFLGLAMIAVGTTMLACTVKFYQSGSKDLRELKKTISEKKRAHLAHQFAFDTTLVHAAAGKYGEAPGDSEAIRNDYLFYKTVYLMEN